MYVPTPITPPHPLVRGLSEVPAMQGCEGEVWGGISISGAKAFLFFLSYDGHFFILLRRPRRWRTDGEIVNFGIKRETRAILYDTRRAMGEGPEQGWLGGPITRCGLEQQSALVKWVDRRRLKATIRHLTIKYIHTWQRCLFFV